MARGRCRLDERPVLEHMVYFVRLCYTRLIDATVVSFWNIALFL